MKKRIKKRIWFKRKLYGWGWTPVTWEGWLVIILVVALTVAVPFGLGLVLNIEDNPEREVFVALAAILSPIALVPLLIWVSYKKGEKPMWQWGERVEDEGE